jgi:c-di-GMP-binding flagellar brake protein YcgR
MKERRKTRRKHLFDYFDVVNRETNEPAGRLADISLEGIKLKSRHSIAPNTHLSLRVILPAHERCREIAFEAQSVWSSRQATDYDTGFQIVRVSHLDAEKIVRTF